MEPYLGVAVYLEAHKRNATQYRPAADATAAARFGELTGAGVLQLLVPLSPMLALRHLSASLARTDMSAHLRFTKQAEQYRQGLVKQMNDAITLLRHEWFLLRKDRMVAFFAALLLGLMALGLYNAQLERQQEALGVLRFLSPALAFQQALHDVAGTGGARHARCLRLARVLSGFAANPRARKPCARRGATSDACTSCACPRAFLRAQTLAWGLLKSSRRAGKAGPPGAFMAIRGAPQVVHVMSPAESLDSRAVTTGRRAEPARGRGGSSCSQAFSADRLLPQDSWRKPCSRN